MNYEEAQKKAVALAEKGDLDGINRLLQKATAAGINPALVQLLGTYREKALLNLGGRRSSGRP